MKSQTDTATGKHAGILAIEVYSPSVHIKQSMLEKHNDISAGKYTIGLGQQSIGVVCGDVEDINSICLTVVHSLLEKYSIDPNEVGRLEVGTETLVDKSKSTKTILMSLFGDNTDIEGATVVNACYGGTAALLNALDWVASDYWDGRYAIVVAADIAAYAPGSARPTSGAGAVALLIGRDAPIAFYGEKATHAADVWDFYKPDPSVEYPTVDGKLSQTCYYQALEDCYTRFAKKIEQGTAVASKEENEHVFDAQKPDYFIFHAPYNKLVQKSYGRLFLMDARRKLQRDLLGCSNADEKKELEEKEIKENVLGTWLTAPVEETYIDRGLEKTLKELSSTSFRQRLADANIVSQRIGNTYTASVFMGLASLIDIVGRRGDLEVGKNVVVFSYGSGALATMYRLHIREPNQSKFTISKMTDALNLMARLDAREELDASELDKALDARARMHTAGAPYKPQYQSFRLLSGTYYLDEIDANFVRKYKRIE